MYFSVKKAGYKITLLYDHSLANKCTNNLWLCVQKHTYAQIHVREVIDGSGFKRNGGY